MKCCFWKKHFRVRCIKSVPENEPCWDHFQRKRSLKWPLPSQVEAGCKSWGWLHWDRLRHITCLLHTGQVMDKVTAFFLRLFKRWEVNEAWHFGVHSKGPWVQTAWPLLAESMFDASLLGYVQLASPQALFPDLLQYIPVGCYFFSPSGCTWISVLWWFFFSCYTFFSITDAQTNIDLCGFVLVLLRMKCCITLSGGLWQTQGAVRKQDFLHIILLDLQVGMKKAKFHHILPAQQVLKINAYTVSNSLILICDA